MIAVVVMTCSVITLSTGCKGLRPVQERIVTKHDSIFKERSVYVHDTVFETKTTRVTHTLQIPCPEEFRKANGLNSHSKNGNANIDTELDGESLVITGQCDSVQIKAKLRDIFEREYREKTRELTDNKVIIQWHTPTVVKWLAWTGAIALASGGIYLGFKIKSIIS